jgi:hypothetical protein
VIRQLAASLGGGFALAVSAAAAPPAIDSLAPAAAQRSTATLVLADGAGAERLAVWKATNARAELCLGWIVATTATPTRFTCLRRGLERPVLGVETGGGFGGQATWGIVAGLVSPGVSRLSAETGYGSLTTRNIELRHTGSLRGWRTFTTGVLRHPSSTMLKAYDRSGTLLVEVSGAAIHPTAPASGGTVTPPPVNGQSPLPSGPAWADTAATLGEAPAAETAISTALANTTVASLVSTHPTWIEGASSWFACNGRRLGSVLSVRFASPVTFTASLPAVVRPSGASAYAVTLRRVAVSGARGLSVWVDASLAQVVGIEPTAWPLAPGRGPVTTLETVSPAHDQGGPDTPNCWQSSG